VLGRGPARGTRLRGGGRRDACWRWVQVGNLEEMIDDNHAIVSSSVGPEYYVNIMSFVDRDLLEPGCSVLTHNKVLSVVGILADDVDPLVSVMKVDKAPLETYADIGGLETQIQEARPRGPLDTHPLNPPPGCDRPRPARSHQRASWLGPGHPSAGR